MILIRAKLLHLAFTSRIINNEVPSANTQFSQMRVRGCGDVDVMLERGNGCLLKFQTKMMQLIPLFAGMKILHLYQKKNANYTLYYRRKKE